MKFGTWLAIYFVIWWTVLFAVLPFSLRGAGEVAEAVPGSDPGAPVRPRFGFILSMTTAVSLGVFVVVWWLIENHWVT